MAVDSGVATQDDPVSSWLCTFCGCDNAPEHCDGEADADHVGVDVEFPNCDPGVVCVCGCEDCNPSVCRNCGKDL